VRESKNAERETKELVIPRRIADRNPKDFRGNEAGEVYYVKHRIGGTAKTPVDPMRVIHVASGASGFYGRSVLQAAFSDIWEVDRMRAYMLDALQRQGWPLIKITLPAHLDPSIRAERARIYKEAFRNVAILVDEVLEDKIEPVGDGTVTSTFVGSEQLDRIRMLYRNIEIAITLASFSDAEQGSYARDQVQQDLLFLTTVHDAMVRDAIVNAWIERVMVVNYPDMDSDLWPFAKSDATPSEDLSAKHRMMLDWKQAGFPVDPDQVSEMVGMRFAEGAETWLATKEAGLNGIQAATINETVMRLVAKQITSEHAMAILVGLGLSTEESEIVVNATLSQRDTLEPNPDFTTQKPSRQQPGGASIPNPIAGLIGGDPQQAAAFSVVRDSDGAIIELQMTDEQLLQVRG
jgi:hypothetical protein